MKIKLAPFPSLPADVPVIISLQITIDLKMK